ncbi:unnamed protein product [Macrosiphum euphorbiae]|uniref:Retrotransposon gag domain-containing protein n=1 Tax=Macrosiphum euphorbiae TaxID=13131 RepID=A0AAV0XRF1_9HEMI|nr:unnamed protein product [Macrosiphum euphorbiae]
MTVTIKLENAFKLIPLCTGIDDIYPFINACDMAVSLVDTNSAPTLVKYITTRLTGRALEMIKYKNVSKWQFIKNYLTDAFEVTTTASPLQLQLNSIRMNHDEDVNDYCHRVEKLYYQLCAVSTLGKEPAEAKIIYDILREQTLAIFIKGLVEPIRTIVKSRNAKTLEIAKQIAMSEQVELRLEQENRNHYSNIHSKIITSADRITKIGTTKTLDQITL